MLGTLRDQMNKKPWIGWAVAGVILLTSALFFWRSRGGNDPYSPDRITELVTIKFTDTGEEITMRRGRMELELRGRKGTLDSTTGITNPKTGAPTGFLYNKDDWEATCKRLNDENERAAQKHPSAAKK